MKHSLFILLLLLSSLSTSLKPKDTLKDLDLDSLLKAKDIDLEDDKASKSELEELEKSERELKQLEQL